MGWSNEELATIAREDEIELASARADGSLRSPAVIWMARVGDDIFVRSAHGTGNRWFVRARDSGAGTIRAGDVTRRARFEDVSATADHSAIDAAYHAKYDGRYPAQYVTPVTDARSHAATLRVLPGD
jgi:hypothetical protein